MDVIAFLQAIFLPNLFLLLAMTLIIYVLLRIFLEDKIGKDVAFFLSFSLAFLAMFSTMTSEFIRSMIQFGITLLVIIFLGVLIFGAFVGMKDIKRFFTWKPFVGLVGVTLFFGAILYLGSYLSGPQASPQPSNQTISQNISEGYTTVTGRPISPIERIIFNPTVLFTVLFFLFFAVVAFVAGRE